MKAIIYVICCLVLLYIIYKEWKKEHPKTITYNHFFQYYPQIANKNQNQMAYIFDKDSICIYSEWVDTNSPEMPVLAHHKNMDCVVYLGTGEYSHLDGSGVDYDKQLEMFRKKYKN